MNWKSERWILGTLLIHQPSLGAQDKSAWADSLYRQAVSRLATAPPEESIQAFQTVLKTDWDHAPAHHELAKLYLETGTVAGRMRAEKSVKRAIDLNPDQVAYQLTWGNILWAQSFTGNAEAHFQEMIGRFPDHPQPRYYVGYYALMNF